MGFKPNLHKTDWRYSVVVVVVVVVMVMVVVFVVVFVVSVVFVVVVVNAVVVVVVVGPSLRGIVRWFHQGEGQVNAVVIYWFRP